MNTKRGRPGIKPHIKQLICAKALQNKAIPRLALAVELKNLIEEMGEIPPTEETMTKLISQARNHPVSECDTLWSLGSLAEHPIPPEAMPAVMSAYKKALAENGELTIREAQWIARLYKIIDSPDLVWDWAWAYAMDEWLAEITKTPFDTTKLDLEMIQDVYSARERRLEFNREIAIWEIALKYDADPVKLKDLNLSIEQTEEIARSNSGKSFERVEIPKDYCKQAARLADALTEAELIDLAGCNSCVHFSGCPYRPSQLRKSKEAQHERQHKTEKQK